MIAQNMKKMNEKNETLTWMTEENEEKKPANFNTEKNYCISSVQHDDEYDREKKMNYMGGAR